MKISLLTIAIMFTVITSSNVQAFDVEVKLSSPEKYTDVILSGKSRKQSLIAVKKHLQKLLSDTSNGYVANENTLILEVTNLDLPGYIDYATGSFRQDIRIIKDVEIYKLKFNYQLVDSNQNELKSGEANIKGFLTNHTTRVANSQLRRNKYGTISYFANDIADWFKSEFTD